MANAPKKPKTPNAGMSTPKSPSPKTPANDPMLDAIRNASEDEPHFGASPGAVQAANAVLMANIRSKLGNPPVMPDAGPVYAGPASAMPKMAAPTIDLPAKPEMAKPTAEVAAPLPPEADAVEVDALEAEDSAQSSESAHADAIEPPAAGEIDVTDADAAMSPPQTETAERAEAAPEVSGTAVPDMTSDAAETQETGTQSSETEAALSAPETTFTETPVAAYADEPTGGADDAASSTDSLPESDAADTLAQSEPKYRSVFDGPEEDDDLMMRPTGISPASARIAPAERTEIAFGDVSTTSERAARAFPHLTDKEFVGEAPLAENESAIPTDPYKDWHTTQSPRQRRRWRWALAGLLVAGVGINAFLLRETDTTKNPAAAASPAISARPPEPSPMAARAVPATTEMMTPEPAPAAQPFASLPPVPPPVAHAAMPVSNPAPVDPQRILRLLSRP